ncbi:CU044_5270 family protein [Nonomuraea guangzhouensis]|uniref:CU044_5270 family protein n=1 Tax=Nonomuraea guangzhouensis TaxID=1291555 RepID=A0ABW4G4A2_9ACTN|nr:CU044_5270 family protein [Nonomuraea guangzhouensis]
MNSIEDRLRDAMAARAEIVGDDDRPLPAPRPQRLQDRMRGRGRRTGWLVPALTLATAAAAVVAVLVTGVITPVGAPTSGREVLLMAAVSAERTPQGSGTYWHVTREMRDGDNLRRESWTARDGRRWSIGEPEEPPGVVVADPAPLRLKGAEVSIEDLERLPTDPEALKARLAGLQGRDGAMTASEQRGDPLFSLVTLISELPTPPEVRSAAFRALATIPGVESMGAVEGGQELRFPHPDFEWEVKLVVDPETAQVTRANYLTGNDGSVSFGNRFIWVTAGWTDQPPR